MATQVAMRHFLCSWWPLQAAVVCQTWSLWPFDVDLKNVFSELRRKRFLYIHEIRPRCLFSRPAKIAYIAGTGCSKGYEGVAILADRRLSGAG